jgi:hypothetical protein
VFTGRMVEVLGHHLHTRPARPSERLGSAVPGALEDAILSCLEKDPERRPRDAQTLIDLLDAAGVEPWTEADARAWWAARAAIHASEALTPPTGGRLRPARTAETDAMPAGNDAGRSRVSAEARSRP